VDETGIQLQEISYSAQNVQVTPQNQDVYYPKVFQQPQQPIQQPILQQPIQQPVQQPIMYPVEPQSFSTQPTNSAPQNSSNLGFPQTISSAKNEPMKNRFKKVLVGIWKLITTRGSTLMQQYGTDLYFFDKYIKYQIIFCFIFMIIANGVLLPIDFIYADKSRYADFAMFTIGALNPKSGARIAHTVVHYVYVIGGFVLVFLIVRIVTHKRRLFFSEYTVRRRCGK
jgi:hypothetical protein